MNYCYIKKYFWQYKKAGSNTKKKTLKRIFKFYMYVETLGYFWKSDSDLLTFSKQYMNYKNDQNIYIYIYVYIKRSLRVKFRIIFD